MSSPPPQLIEAQKKSWMAHVIEHHFSECKRARQERETSPRPPRSDSPCSTSSQTGHSSGVETTSGEDAPADQAPRLFEEKRRGGRGGRRDDFTPHEDAELFFFGHDDNGCPDGTNRHGDLPTANLKWAKREDALTRFTAHGVLVPNTTAGRRKLQNRLIALKKRHVAEGEGFLQRLRIMRASHRAFVSDVEAGIHDDDDFVAVGALLSMQTAIQAKAQACCQCERARYQDQRQIPHNDRPPLEGP